MEVQRTKKAIPAWAPYLFAVASITAAGLVRASMADVLGERSRHLLFILPILLTALYGGIGPGLFALIFASILSLTLRRDTDTSYFETAGDQIGFGLYLIVGLGVVLLAHREREEKTRREVAEADLASLNEQLERRVHERTAQLEAANRELEGFCYSVSHDLRTPMRAIAGNARILLEDFADKVPETMRDKLVRMETAANKLGDLVEGLLTYARLANQELEIERVNVTELVQDAVRAAGREMKCEVRLDAEPDLSVAADAKMARIAITALVKNAVRYRKPGEPAVIRVRRDPSQGADAIRLEDEGIGIDLTYRHKIFMPFERLHRDEEYPGVGMGLAHVKRIVERHHGTIEVESEPGIGAAFTFSFGSHPEASPASEQASRT